MHEIFVFSMIGFSIYFNCFQLQYIIVSIHRVSLYPCLKSQYCGEPPWPRGNVLGHRPPGLEFRILCLEDSVIPIISHPQEVLLAQFSLYVHKGGLKPDSFHLFSCKPISVSETQ